MPIYCFCIVIVCQYHSVASKRVQNTRKKYKAIKFQHEDGFHRDGSPKLSAAQIELLDKIDFNWDPWNHYDDGTWPLIDYTS